MTLRNFFCINFSRNPTRKGVITVGWLAEIAKALAEAAAALGAEISEGTVGAVFSDPHKHKDGSYGRDVYRVKPDGSTEKIGHTREGR